jgi:hypothetical protein
MDTVTNINKVHTIRLIIAKNTVNGRRYIHFSFWSKERKGIAIFLSFRRININVLPKEY